MKAQKVAEDSEMRMSKALEEFMGEHKEVDEDDEDDKDNKEKY